VLLAESRDLIESDVVFVALHGGAGEDGTLQAVLDLAGVPYTGSGMLASALAMDKHRAKQIFAAAGIPVAPGVLLRDSGDPIDPRGLGGYPLVVKPNRQGSSVGVHVVEREAGLPAALEDAFSYGEVLVEKFIPGRELTVAVLGGEPLPVVEIVTDEGFYDYRHKYTRGHTRYEVPASLDPETAVRLGDLGAAAFTSLGCSGVARVDFRLDPENRPFCLEVNTVPGMTETSLVPMAAREGGIDYRALVDHLVTLAGSGS
jgi:D-alanine-D-alanine ligase